MSRFGKLDQVRRSFSNLPDPAVDPTAPSMPPAADDTGDTDDLTCPKCGTSLSLKAVAKPNAAPPDAAGAPPMSSPLSSPAPADDTGGGF